MVGSSKGRSPQFLRRVHNRPALRRKSQLLLNMRLVGVAAGLGVGGGLAYVGTTWALESEAFVVDRVSLAQVPRELRTAVADQLLPTLGHNLLLLDLEALRRWVEDRVPQLQSVAIRRLLPHDLEVEAKTRAPWAVLQATDGRWVVDIDGVVLSEEPSAIGNLADPEPGRPDAKARPRSDTLPLLYLDASIADDVERTHRLPLSAPGVAWLPDAATIVEWLERTAPAEIGVLAYLRLGSEGVVLVPLHEPWEIVLGRAERLEEKMLNLRAIRSNDAARLGPEVERIDLSYRDMVVVRDNLAALGS